MLIVDNALLVAAKLLENTSKWMEYKVNPDSKKKNYDLDADKRKDKCIDIAEHYIKITKKIEPLVLKNIYNLAISVDERKQLKEFFKELGKKESDFFDTNN